MKKKNLLIIIVILAVFTISCCAVIVGGLAAYRFINRGDGGILPTVEDVDVTVVSPSDDQPAETVGPSPSPQESPSADPVEDEEYFETLEILETTEVPTNNPLELAERLEGKENIPLTQPVEDLHREVGEKDTFWVMDTDTVENFQITATLQAATDHLYFWIEDGVDFSVNELNKLAEDFEDQIYPTNRAFFGSEWSPGVDEDPHLYVIYASGLGNSLAGYFSSVDEYHPQANEYSNAHETFMLNADNVGLDETFTYGVLAHEFQHMIHWFGDSNETSWLNEGFSELATLLNGYHGSASFDYVYAQDPDLQLNDWPNDQTKTTPHYGSSFLFVTYFLDRFGNDATQALVSHDLNGMSSVDHVLEDMEATDPVTGEIITANDVFLDWVMTNYLGGLYNLSGRYAYSSYSSVPRFRDTEEIGDCPTAPQERTVHQYGVDYVSFTCPGDYTLRFEGEKQVGVLSESAHSGDYAFWSNKGDASDMALTKTFDFTGQEAPLTLTYWTWYDLEEDYDYLFLETSTDGENWDILQTPSGTDEDPSGNSYGWGYNGLSGGDGSWVQEEVDLSRFAGQEVQIRFEYVTDAAVNGEGLLLDDIAVPEVGYASDLEEDSGGWTGAGFVRIRNVLPQTYRLALIRLGDSPQIEYLTLSPGNELEIPLTLGGDAPDEAILVVTGTTRYTRQLADYRFWVEE